MRSIAAVIFLVACSSSASKTKPPSAPATVSPETTSPATTSPASSPAPMSSDTKPERCAGYTDAAAQRCRASGDECWYGAPMWCKGRAPTEADELALAKSPCECTCASDRERCSDVK